MNSKKTYILATVTLLTVTLIPAIWLVQRQNTDPLRHPERDLRVADIAELRSACGTCHLPPEPTVLPKSGWQSFMSRKELVLTRHADVHWNTLPTVDLLLADNNLQRITRDFVDRAETQAVLLKQTPEIQKHSGLFRETTYVTAQPPVAYTSIEFDPETESLVAANNYGRALEYFDLTGQKTDAISLPGFPIVPLKLQGRWLIPTVSMRPDPDKPAGGMLVRAEQTPSSQWQVFGLLKNLRRPIRVQTIPSIDQGSPPDAFLLIEFGWADGEIGIYTISPSGESHKLGVLDDRSGAIDARILSADKHHIQLAVLTSQENEELLLVQLDRPSLTLREKRVLYKAHPAFGFNSLAITDINKDGHPDIIVTNGDNMDIPSGPLKPYHGIRIFLADTNGQGFLEPIFLPMHGAIQTIVKDFTGNGKPDIFAISAFPDYHIRPYQSALLFVNEGNSRFSPEVITAAQGGRWVAATAADWDGDGDLDIALAAAYTTMNQADRRWTEYSSAPHKALLLLENTSR